MATQIMLLPPAVYNAMKVYEVATPILGLNKVLDIFEAHAGPGLRLKSKIERAGVCNAKNALDKSLSKLNIQMKFEVYAPLLDDLITNFASAEAQYILPYLLPVWMLDMDQFSLIGEFYSSNVDGGNTPSFGIAPNMRSSFYQLGAVGLKSGLYGNKVLTTKAAQMTRSAGVTAKASMPVVYNSKVLKVVQMDDDSNIIQSEVSGTITSGGVDIVMTPGAGSYDGGYIRISSLLLYKAADSPAFLQDIDIVNADGFQGVMPMNYIT